MINVRAYLTLIRPFNAVIAFFVTASAYLIAKKTFDFDKYTLILAGSTFFAIAAGNVINDLFDLEIDRINKPNRILPAGKISIKAAWVFYFVLLVCSTGLALFFAPKVAILNIFANVLLYLYSKWFKRLPLIGNIFIAFLTSYVFIYSGLAAKNITPIIMFAIFSFLINLAREIVKDIEDIDGDKTEKIRTFVIEYGETKSKFLIAVTLIVLIVTTLIPFLLRWYLIEYFVVVSVFLIPLLVNQIVYLFKCTSTEEYCKISKYLKLAILIGFLAILAGDGKFRQLF